tara:strand:+ start:287 stop:730 length:444 start_codon:yes stop_codon:yes gene_type:complete
MDYKKTNAARTTVSRNMEELSQNVGGNVYELIAVLKKRASQIGVEIKEELIAKLDEFATPSDTLEEVFENQEQTEISRFYERLPKPTLIAIQEMLDDEIYMREEVKKEDDIELENVDEVEENGNEVEETNNIEGKTEKSADSDSANA